MKEKEKKQDGKEREKGNCQSQEENQNWKKEGIRLGSSRREE